MKFFLFFLVFLNLLFGAPVPDKEAFKVFAKEDEKQIVFDVKLDSSVYVYADKVTLFDDTGELSPTLPRPEKLKDYEVFRGNFSLIVPKNNSTSWRLELLGCALDGFCYKPQVFSFELKGGKIYATNELGFGKFKPTFGEKNLDKFDKNEFNASGDKTTTTEKSEKTEKSETEQIAAKFGGAFLLTLLAFLGYGLMLSFTPCAFPMIPILSQILLLKGGKNGFLTALFYVLGMAFAYSMLGILVSLFGVNLGAALQNKFVLLSFSLLFVLLSLPCFGVFEVRLPAAFETFVSRKTSNLSGLFGVFLLGLFSSVVLSPCVAAPFAGAVLYISQSKSVLTGGLALWCMGFGMGLPLLLLGVFGSKVLPRPGVWMERVKVAFGFLMLFLAVWIAGRAFAWAYLNLAYAVLFLAMVFCFTRNLPRGKFAVALFCASVCVAVFLAASGFFGDERSRSNVPVVNSVEALEAVLSKNEKVVVDFWASWCENCKDYEAFFSKNKFDGWQVVKVDITENSEQTKAFLERFGVFAPPTILFFESGEEQRQKRTLGSLKAEKFRKFFD